MRTLVCLLFMVSFLSACLSEAPRNRPTFSPYQGIVNDDIDNDYVFEPPKRPDGEVYLQAGHCGCKDGEPITLGNCRNFCQGKSNGSEMLYVDIRVGDRIQTSNLIDFYGWCTRSLIYTDPETGEVIEDGIQAACEVQVTDENGSLGSLNFSPRAGSNNMQVDITALDWDKTYRLKVVETSSGASSSTIQVRKVTNRVEDPVGGPLRLMPVNQYTCISRDVSNDDDNGDTFFETASRSHYYFVDENRPEPLPAVFANIYCHDYRIYGTTPRNNPLLEETPGAFTLWDKWDPRFFFLNEAEPGAPRIRTIHQLLHQRILDLGYDSSQAPEVFYELPFYNGPPIAADGSNQTPEPQVMGWYMQPFVDVNTHKAYCPTANHYNSINPLFRAMKHLVGVDTEGLYIAKQESVCDVIFVRESILKEIWFYIENGVHYEPNDDTISGKQIQFYWPADPESPYVKKSHQRVYTLKRAGEPLCGGNSVGNGSVNDQPYPPHDKRIGCIPAL